MVATNQCNKEGYVQITLFIDLNIVTLVTIAKGGTHGFFRVGHTNIRLLIQKQGGMAG